MTSIVLAGGKSLRLGKSKCLETINGKSLIERVIERVKSVSRRTLIVTSREQIDFPAPCEAEVVVDIYPGKGPLGGIYTGLLASESSHVLAVACDMPLLNIELLRYMIELSPGFDAVVPRLGERKVEPLHAIYAKSCLDNMKTRLEHNQLEISRFLNTVHVRYIERPECQKFDPQLLTFFNINSQSDLDQAITLATENKS
ncbi:MAG TPA: molybdenum cofactor guanylyltransferase [Dehalococcoidia bacterium]|jgi:molybdopterin-guanine dinucleotide biosynthesis protein A|nr:molybdenum cofactor guanylyltransferase [Dehalococcoidia bacterium]